jgi:hypothetical protein
MMMKKLGISKEQKVAIQMLSELDRISLNLEEVGRYIGRQDNMTLNRLMIIIEAAEEEKENQIAREHTTLF